MGGRMHSGLKSPKTKEVTAITQPNSNQGMTQGEAVVQIVNRLMRKTGMAERIGASGVLDQLEITPIPIGAVIPIANSVTKAAILDGERIRLRIPLVYIWLETYELAVKGSKRFAFLLKDLAAEQLAGKVEENLAQGEEGE
jgi:hypothetical protein